jgi:hypothetical protein
MRVAVMMLASRDILDFTSKRQTRPFGHKLNYIGPKPALRKRNESPVVHELQNKLRYLNTTYRYNNKGKQAKDV